MSKAFEAQCRHAALEAIDIHTKLARIEADEVETKIWHLIVSLREVCDDKKLDLPSIFADAMAFKDRDH